MRLIALLIVRPAPPPTWIEGDLSQATLGAFDIGGQSILEFQMRQALTLGVDAVIVRADTPLPVLSQLVEQLEREAATPVQLVADGPDLTRHVDPDDRIVLFGAGMVVPQSELEALIDATGPVLLVTETEAGTAHFERIDGHHVWAGALSLSGETVLATVDMLGEWDLELTLLRRAVQQSAARVVLAPARAVDGDLAKIETPADVERIMSLRAQDAFAQASGRDLLEAALAPLGRRLLPALAALRPRPAQIDLAAGLLSLVALGSVSFNLPALALALLLVAQLACGLSDKLADILLRPGSRLWVKLLVKGAGLATLLIIGGRLAEGNRLALLGIMLPIALIAIQTIADEKGICFFSGRSGLWKRFTIAMALTIMFCGSVAGNMVDAFILVGLCAFGTVAVRLLAAQGKTI